MATLATYNVTSGRNGRLEQALRAMKVANVDVGVLTEAKLTKDIYTRFSSGYHVMATEAPSAQQGGVALFWRDSPTHQVEGQRTWGPNVVSFELVTGGLRYYVVGAYCPPSDPEASTTEDISAAFGAAKPGRQRILIGDVNAVVAEPRDARDDIVADCVAAMGLGDLGPHFRPRPGKGRWTYQQRRADGTKVQSTLDYVFGEDRRLVQSVRMVSPRLMETDHRMVVAHLRMRPSTSHRAYLNARKRFPYAPPVERVEGGAEAAADFGQLLENVVKPGPREARRNEWISPATWALVDRRASLRREGLMTSRELRQMNRQVRQSLNQDRRVRASKRAAECQNHMRNDRVIEAFAALSGWWREAASRPPRPSREDLVAMTAERRELYRKVPSPRGPIPTRVNFQVDDSVPDESEIRMAVNALKTRRAAGPSGMRAENLRGWAKLAEVARQDQSEFTRPEDRTEGDAAAAADMAPWEACVRIVQRAFRDGIVPDRLLWSTVVLLPKGDGGHRGIGLLEPLWKAISTLISRRLMKAISFHDFLHGFVEKRGTGTATLEAKLAHQLAARDQEPLYEVFLDLRKAYDALDRERTLMALKGYGVGDRILRLLSVYWEGARHVCRTGGYYGTPFRSERGVTQGDPVSPVIFNVVVDCVVRHWCQLVFPENTRVAENGLGYDVRGHTVLFYADDALLASRDANWLQTSFTTICDLFERVGLQTNASKTKVMIAVPRRLMGRELDSVHKRRIQGGDSHRERQRRRVECSECGLSLSAGSLTAHMRTRHGIYTTGERQDAEPPHRVMAHTWDVHFPKGGGRVACPYPGCPSSATTPGNMRKHFLVRHHWDLVRIPEEGGAPLPQCEKCGLQLPWTALNGVHPGSASCRKGEERKRQRKAIETLRRSNNVRFTAGDATLETVQEFRYLGRVLTKMDNDLPAATRQLQKARVRWARLARVLRQEDIQPSIASIFYKVIIQAVLLFGSETWDVSPSMLARFEGFHYRAACQMSGRRARRGRGNGGEWVYPPSREVRKAANLQLVSYYLGKRRARIAFDMENRPILRLCKDSQRMPGSRNRPYWWDQDLSAPEEEVWSDEDEGSEPSIAPSDDTPTQFTRDPRPVMQGLELEGFEQPAEGEQPTPSNIPWAHRARAGET